MDKEIRSSLRAGSYKYLYTVSSDLYCNKTLPNAMERTLGNDHCKKYETLGY